MPSVGGKGFVLFALATLGSVLFSLLLYYGLDRPIQAFRTSVKKHGLVLPQYRQEAASGA